MSDIQSDAPSKIIINGQEFDPEEAEQLIETGRKTREYEQRYNTNLDKVWPEYNRSSQTVKQLEAELAQAKGQLTEFSTKREEGSETPADVQKAREAAKKLGLVLDEDLSKNGYIKKTDLDSWYQEQRQKEQSINQVLSQADQLEKEVTGTDGRPKFNKKAVLAYASAYGYSDLNQAYEDMHEEALKPWKEAQIAAQKAKSLKTLHGSGGKSPSSPKVTDDNLKDALRETLWGAKEE